MDLALLQHLLMCKLSNVANTLPSQTMYHTQKVQDIHILDLLSLESRGSTYAFQCVVLSRSSGRYHQGPAESVQYSLAP